MKEELEIGGGSNRPNEQLDAHWYERFSEFGSFQAYEYLNGDKEHRAKEKEDFLAGNKENPNLDYPNVDLSKLDSNEEQLLHLKKDVLEQETNEVVKQVYRWRINEKLAELRMLRAVAKGDMNRFRRYSEFIYGKPSAEGFQYTVANIRNQIIETITSDNEDLVTAARDLDEALPQTTKTSSFVSLPTTEEFNNARNATLQQIGDLIDIPIEGDEVDAQYIKEAFDEAFSKLDLSESDWKVIVDTASSRTGISVNQETKTVLIPESRKILVRKLKQLIAHEIGTHVARREKGERSKLKILGLGLDRYERGEEGLATMREQVIDDKLSDFSGLAGHLAISLAKGLDGKPRDFRQTYEILYKYFYWNALRKGGSKDEAGEDAVRLAWNRSVRTFRGTDSATPGVCFTKDMIYREGNIGVWNVISKNRDELQRFQVGKYDPANPRHIWVLESLGITDADLEALEEDL